MLTRDPGTFSSFFYSSTRRCPRGLPEFMHRGWSMKIRRVRSQRPRLRSVTGRASRCRRWALMFTGGFDRWSWAVLFAVDSKLKYWSTHRRASCPATPGQPALLVAFVDPACTTPLGIALNMTSTCTPLLTYGLEGTCLNLNNAGVTSTSTVGPTTTARPASAGRLGAGVVAMMGSAVVGLAGLLLLV